MKANDKQAKKNLSAAELKSELRQAQENQFKLEFKHKVSPLSSPIELRTARRHIARLKTWIAQKDSAAAR
jgi:large subunit ribosomal protein L29